jgi:threonine/homoserine/homoserine lactone efflux protein
MDFWFLLKCFFIGFSASSAMGPIFILTFNRGALSGFLRGFATACGSALADGIFFALGLLGALELIENSKQALLTMNFIGGTLLITMGIMTIKKHQQTLPSTYSNVAIVRAFGKSFLLTIFNPIAALFFMFMSVQFLSDELTRLPINQIIFSSLMVFCGSLTTLSFVALIGHCLGSTIDKAKLSIMSLVTGFVFILTGIFFIIKFLLNVHR